MEFKNNDRKTLRIDLINNIVIYGSSLVTTPIMNFIVRKGISLAYLSKTGKFKACVIPPVSKNIFRRISQYKIFSDEASRIEFAKEVVKAKIINQLHFIQEYNNHKPIENFHEYKRNTMTYIEILGLAEKSESILGIEGIASKDYFAMLKKIIKPELGFVNRNKRPPLDPVNSMLSLGYTLLTDEISSLLQAHGIDPFLGFYHTPEYGRPSLASDIIEPFRACMVDRLVLNMANNKIFTAEDFEYNPDSKGCYFKGDLVKKYITEYEKMMNPETDEIMQNRNILWKQIENLIEYLDHKIPFESYIF